MYLLETSLLKYTSSRSCSHLCLPGRKECFPSQFALFPSFEYYSFCSAHSIVYKVCLFYSVYKVIILYTHCVCENMNFTVKLWLNELWIRKHYFSRAFQMDLAPQIFPYPRQMKNILHLSGQKSLFRKTWENASFGKRWRRCYTPSPSLLFRI